nr:DNA-3-methyladenine glycosylase [uncultured Chryseobacterium sp.]
MKLPETYYTNPDTLFLAKDLLGKILYTCSDGNISAGIIVETEAYGGISDQASHAYGGRRTGRTGNHVSERRCRVCLPVLWHPLPF